MAMRRSPWIGLGLAVGTAVVLAGPALLVWSHLRPQPWNEWNLRARFQSARYEGWALVFTYKIENRTRRSAHLAAGATHLRVRQAKDGPPAGYAFVHLPIELHPRSSHTVEIRLDLPAQGAKGWMAAAEEQTRRVFRNDAQASPGEPSPPLPMRDPPKQPQPREMPSVETAVAKALATLEGFELVNDRHGVRLVLPRGW
jgi:hypothetical protein